MGLFKKKGKRDRSKPVSRKIRLCPKCKKPLTHTANSISGFLTPLAYSCQYCGYTGYFFIEVDPAELAHASQDAQGEEDMENSEGEDDESINKKIDELDLY